MSDEDVNPYDLLSLSLEASDQDIKSAYRKLSLKVHPDRNRNNPDAGKKFHELTQAYELLLDPLRRMALDAKVRLKEARKLRYSAFDAKRKAMLDDLEERERQVKKARVEKQQREKEMWHENEKIMDEGRKLREQKERELLQREEEARKAAAAAQEDDEPPALGPLDTTVKLRYSLEFHPNLTTPESLSSLLQPFGAIDTDSVVLSIKSKSSKKKQTAVKNTKIGTALIPFKRIGDAFAVVCASGVKERGLEGIQVSWADTSGREPELIGWLKKKGKLGSDPKPPPDSAPQFKGSSSVPSFSMYPSASALSQPTAPSLAAPGLDYESLTLMRLREAERARLEREILEQEAKEV